MAAGDADWQSRLPGGRGAVREACEFLLQARGALQRLEAGFR
jgi:3-deoxy-D-manno-octulosonate 8-phosphate phosphatase (KDO 8-P phosphatase)